MAPACSLFWSLLCLIWPLQSVKQSIPYQLVATSQGMNDMLDFFGQDIDALVVGTTIPAMDSSDIETSSSEIEAFSWDKLTVSFNESTQMVSLTMTNMSGTIATMDVTAKYKLFVTLTCNGEATPVFWNWNLTFDARLNSSSDDCGLQLSADEDDVVIQTDQLELNEDWYSSTCDTVIDAPGVDHCIASGRIPILDEDDVV